MSSPELMPTSNDLPLVPELGEHTSVSQQPVSAPNQIDPQPVVNRCSSSPSPSYIYSEISSDADSETQCDSKKRKRRADWSPEKIQKERERLKMKKQRQKAEGKAKPHKKSQAQKDRKKARRAEKRMNDSDDEEGPTPAGYRLPKGALRKWGLPIEIPTNFKMEDATAAQGAYVGINRPVDDRFGTDEYTLEGELVKGRKLQP